MQSSVNSLSKCGSGNSEDAAQTRRSIRRLSVGDRDASESWEKKGGDVGRKWLLGEKECWLLKRQVDKCKQVGLCVIGGGGGAPLTALSAGCGRPPSLQVFRWVGDNGLGGRSKVRQ